MSDMQKNDQELALIPEILGALKQYGIWERAVEWSDSASFMNRIEHVDFEDMSLFKVNVSCGHNFSCLCPTIERAVECMQLYQGMIKEAFYQAGWPSWKGTTV